jgi:hypothetical protein
MIKSSVSGRATSYAFISMSKIVSDVVLTNELKKI